MTALQGCRPHARRLQHSQEVDVDTGFMQGICSSALNVGSQTALQTEAACTAWHDDCLVI